MPVASPVYPQPDAPLCFIRIPKTGSTTLVSILDAQFPIEQICPILVADLPNYSPQQLAHYRLFRDHFDYDIRDYLPKPPVYLTLLRHPVDRAISYYEFCKRGTNPGEFDQYLKAAAQEGIQSFTAHPDPTIRIRTANLQTRQLAIGLGSRHSNPFEPSAYETQYSDEQLFELAQQHLNDCAFVGITDYFQASLLLLAYRFGWYPVTEFQSLRVANKTSKRESLTPDELDAILAVNAYDVRLYDYAQSLFRQRFEDMLEDLSQHEEWLKGDRTSLLASLNQLAQLPDAQRIATALDNHYAQAVRERAPQPIAALDFDFLQPISGAGWHRRNGAYSGLIITSTPFRWTGPGTESTLDFSLATDQDLKIRIRITNAAAPDILDSLSLKVNSHAIALKPLLRQGPLAVLEGTIPQSALVSDRPFTRLTFRVNRTLSLQALNPNSPDKRVVGLAVQRIQLFPAAQHPKPAEFTDLLLPDDPLWTEAAQFLHAHLQPNEQVAAPVEFLDGLGNQYLPLDQPFAEQANWVVVHKGRLEAIAPASLTQCLSQWQPVFANAVFIVLTQRGDLKPLDANHPDWRSLQASWRERNQPSWLRSLKRVVKRR